MQLKKLLQNIIQINPYFRFSARECLRDNLFKGYKNKQDEKLRPEKIKLLIDQDKLFDYEEN